MPLLVAGRLRLLDPIGEGGTGTVHRAWDLRTRRFVAAKLLPASRVAMPVAWPERSLRISHPHVLTADEVLTTRDLVVLLMRLVRGGTADRLLAERGALRTDFVAVLLDQLLDALGAVHRAGLVHGDVKPANLLLEATGTGRPHLLLADFGATTRAGDRASSATDGYLAPEAEAGAAVDPRRDLFAAGVTVTELLTGRPPRRAGEIPHGPLRTLLRDLVATDPAARPPDTTAARARLRALGVPMGSPWRRRPRPPEVPDRHRRARRQRP